MTWNPEIKLPRLRRGKDAAGGGAAIARVRAKGGSSKRHKQLVGVKVGASQLAAAEVVNNGAPQLVRVARAPLPGGVVTAGELREPEALSAALDNFFREHGFPREAVRLGIASNRIGVRSFELSGVEDRRQLANAVVFRAQETLPIPLEEAVLDYQVIRESVEDGVTRRQILLVVAYRELVDRYVAAFDAAGVKLAGIDLEAFGLLRALAAPSSDDTRAGTALVGVALGHERTTFAVSDGRFCQLARVLEWGGALVDGEIARTLGISVGEADEVKRSLSLDGAHVAPLKVSDAEAERAVDAIRRQLPYLARELGSSLRFYQNQEGALPVEEVALTGGTAELPGLAAELERLLGVRVRLADPFARVTGAATPVETGSSHSSLAVPIGLAIED